MIVYCVVLVSVLLSLCGLCVDAGLLEVKRLQLQNAADAFAIGAEQEWERGAYWTFAQGFDTVSAAGAADAATNGFVNGKNGVTMSITYPATTGLYAGRYDAGMLTMTQQVKSTFMGALHGGVTTISASATALFQPCLYMMGANPNGGSSYTFDAASAGMYTSCPVYVNGSIAVDGFSKLTSMGLNMTETNPGGNLGGGSISPSARFGAAVQADPLAYFVSPAYAAPCNHTNLSITTATTLYPGTYCGGIAIKSASVVFSPGLYVVTGGANWSGATVTGTGVTLFFTKGGGSGYGTVSITNSSTIELSAPTSADLGGVPGIVVFGDRCWAGGFQDFQIQNSSFQGDGIWYTTNTGIYSWSGNMRGNNYFSLVTDNIYFFGGTYLVTSNFTVLPGGNPFRPAGGLVE